MSEQFYDEEIAPVLAELAKKCEKRKIPFLAQVEYEPGKTGRTEFLPQSAGFGQRLATWAARCNGNVDRLYITIASHGEEHGHSSVVLSVMNHKP